MKVNGFFIPVTGKSDADRTDGGGKRGCWNENKKMGKKRVHAWATEGCKQRKSKGHLTEQTEQ